jgi:hypothetical protein
MLAATMNKLSFSLLVIALISAGCGPKPGISFKDNDGNTVTVGNGKTTITGKDGQQQGSITTDNNGAVHIDGTDKDGKKVSETIDYASNGGAHIEGTDKDGNHVTETINNNGYAANDGKGNSVKSGPNVVTEDDLGLPFYPGSTEGPNGASMVAKAPDGTTAMSMRTTTDDPSKVMDFYSPKLTGVKPSTLNANGQIMDSLVGTIADGRSATVLITRGTTGDTTVSVSVKPTKKS